MSDRIFILNRFKQHSYDYGLYMLKNDIFYCIEQEISNSSVSRLTRSGFWFNAKYEIFDNNKELLFLLEFNDLIELMGYKLSNDFFLEDPSETLLYIDDKIYFRINSKLSLHKELQIIQYNYNA